MYINHRVGICRKEDLTLPNKWSFWNYQADAGSASEKYQSLVFLLDNGDGEEPVQAVIWIHDTIDMDTGQIASFTNGFKKAKKKNVIHYNQQTITTPSPAAGSPTFEFTTEIYEALTQ